MLWLLLLTLPFAAWVLYHFPDRAAEHDHKKIQEDGANDTLKEWFHFFNGLHRFLFVAWIAGVGAGPLLKLGWLPFATGAAALAVAAGAWFVYRFNPRLSELRGLSRYYVSLDARAAYFPDRFIAQPIKRQYPNATSTQWQFVAGPRLEKLLRRILIIGLAAAVLLAAAAVTLAAA